MRWMLKAAATATAAIVASNYVTTTASYATAKTAATAAGGTENSDPKCLAYKYGSGIAAGFAAYYLLRGGKSEA